MRVESEAPAAASASPAPLVDEPTSRYESPPVAAFQNSESFDPAELDRALLRVLSNFNPPVVAALEEDE